MLALILILFVFGCPIILMIVGLVLSLNSQKETRKTGKRLLIGGAIFMAVEILIGFAVCSNIGGK